MLCFPVWAAAGAYKPWQGFFIPSALLGWMGYIWLRMAGQLPSKGKVEKQISFWASLSFWLYLFLQYARSHRRQVFDPEAVRWGYSEAELHPEWLSWIPESFSSWLPSSVHPPEAWEMLSWFIPVLSALLILRHLFRSSFFSPFFRSAMLLNGLAVAALCFIHLSLGWVKMYDRQAFGDDVYGCFGYPNHGAHFFILLLALAIGSAAQEWFTPKEMRSTFRLWLSLTSGMIFIMAAALSSSRSGLIGPPLLCFLILLLLGRVLWPRSPPVSRTKVAVYSTIASVSIAILFWAVAAPYHLKELQNATTELNVEQEVGARFWQMETAFEIWKDAPIYGVGGWGYRYLVGSYLPREHWHWLTTGKANVHNDLLQFLAEFGILGCTLLLIPFLPYLQAGIRGLRLPATYDRSLWANPLRISSLCGLFVLFLISQFDIPLRSPAVFLQTVLLLNLLLPSPANLSIWPEKVDWERFSAQGTHARKAQKRASSSPGSPDSTRSSSRRH